MQLKKTKILAIVVVCALFVAGSVFADGYVTKEIIPGEASTGEGDFITYLNSLYKLGIGLSGLLAVFMIGFGFFKYIVSSAGNASTMSDAKETIYSAIFGLMLALVAWILLFVINPDLVSNSVSSMPTLKECLTPGNCN